MFNPVTFARELDRANWSAVVQARLEGIPWAHLVNDDGLRALHLAVLRGEPLAVQNLLRQGAPASAYDDGAGRWVSPLWDALRRKDDTIASTLVNAGADPEASDPHVPGASEGPLVAASRHSLAMTTLALLARGVSLRTLPVTQRAQVFEGWFQAQHSPLSTDPARATQATQVIQALADSGWFPVGAEADDLSRRLTAAPIPDPEADAALHRLLACWRERQIQPTASATPASSRRVRS